MASIHLLGTGAGFTDAWRTTTMLALSDVEHLVVIDCGGDVFQRIQAAGLNPAHLKALIITHEHPDHCGGFPLFLEKMWLAQLRDPIHVYGPQAGLDQVKRLYEAFQLDTWPGMPALIWHPVDLAEGALVFEDEVWRITSCQTLHPPPTIALRADHKASKKSMAYSCDTSPSEAFTRLSKEVDLMVHEANLIEKSLPNVHTCIPDAAQVAANAAVQQLILVHLPPGLTSQHLAKARNEIFANMDLGVELGVYDLG